MTGSLYRANFVIVPTKTGANGEKQQYIYAGSQDNCPSVGEDFAETFAPAIAIRHRFANTSEAAVWLPVGHDDSGPIIVKTNPDENQSDSEPTVIGMSATKGSLYFYQCEKSASADSDPNSGQFILTKGQEIDRLITTDIPGEWRIGNVVIKQINEAFILLRANTEKPREALYIGTKSYQTALHQWPDEKAWERVSLPSGETVHAYCPNKETPDIQLLDQQSGPLSPIRLLENTSYYWALLDAEDEKLVSNAKLIAAEGGLTWSGNNKAISAQVAPGAGTFNFGNYLGTASLLKGGRNYAQLESRTLKLSYEDEYLRMLKDLTDEALESIFNRDGITSAHLSALSGKSSKELFGRYLLLRAALPIEKLGSSAAILRAKPHTSLVSTTRWLPSFMASGLFAMGDPIRNIRWQRRKAGGRHIATEALERTRRETTDTPPNQFAKFAIKQFSEIVDHIASRPSSYGQKHADYARAYARECRRHLRLAPLNVCKDLRRIPFESQVLQKRAGYRETFRAWIVSNLGVSIREFNSTGLLSPEAENRDAPKLYELWLITRLKEALKSHCGGEAIYEYRPVMKPSGLALLPSSKKVSPEPLLITRDDAGNLFALYYNRIFEASGHKLGPNSSYSVELKPDYTIEIIPKGADDRLSALDINGETDVLKLYKQTRGQIAPANQILPEHGGPITYVHFDAKYKIDDIRRLSQTDPRKPKAEDIYKMHTYNEAIYGTAISVILYPGNRKQEYRKFTDLIPGVSAIPVRPPRDMTSSAKDEDFTRSVSDLLKIVVRQAPKPDLAKEEPVGEDYTYIRHAERTALSKKSNGRKQSDA